MRAFNLYAIFLFCLSATFSAFAQDRYAGPDAPGGAANGVPLTVSEPAYKTSDADTFIINNHVARCDSIFWHPNAGSSGYLTGTSGIYNFVDADDKPVERRITEHGVSYILPLGFDHEFFLSYAYIYFTSRSRKIGPADDFYLNCYTLSPIPDGGYTIEGGREFGHTRQQFSIDFWDFNDNWAPGEGGQYSNDHLIIFDELRPVSGRQLLTLETSRPNNDDTLCFYFKLPNERCDPNNENDWYIRLRDADFNHVRWQLMNNTFTSARERDYDVPCFVPVLEGVPTSRDEVFVRKNGLGLRPAYPNPATDRAFLPFDLEKPGEARLKILNLQGQTILQDEAPSLAPGRNYFAIETEAWPCGAYVYIIETNQGALGGKIMVE